MVDYLEINHIAPISRYIFSNSENTKYKLVHISVYNGSPSLAIIDIPSIDNINDTVRGYTVNKIIKINNRTGNSDSLKLFKIKDNQLYLLFTGKIDNDYIEYNSKHTVTLHGAPTYTKNMLRNTKYINESSYLNEIFFNFDTSTNDKCIISLLKVKVPQEPYINRIIIKKLNKGYLIYNRYSDNIIVENIPEHIIKKIDIDGDNHNQHLDIFRSYYCENNGNKKSKDPINEFIEDYQIDLNIYKGNNYNNRLKLGYRPKKFEPYINSIITSPVDCRITPIQNNKGFMCRIAPQDYQYVHIPYTAKLINIFNKDKATIYRFETDYFMPNNVYERDLSAVITGNYIHHGVGVGMGSRYKPELLDAQPNTKLTYSLAIMGQHILTNNKFNYKKRDIWFEQGDELCKFVCRGGNIIILFNRDVNPTSDIDNRKYQTYIKLNDIIGIIN